MSAVRSFPRAAHVPQPPGTWSKRHGIVLFVCPLCGAGFPLEHAVLVDGTLGQVLTCPTSACDFREAVRLVGWDA